jgi:hypothetical protein
MSDETGKLLVLTTKATTPIAESAITMDKE